MLVKGINGGQARHGQYRSRYLAGIGNGLLGGFLTGTKGWAHAVGAIDLTQLHTTNNQTRNDLTSAFDDSVLGSVHVETSHTAQLINLMHGHETLDGEGAEWSIMAGCGDYDWGIDGIGVHARLVVVMHRHERPVGDDAGNADGSVGCLAGDEVFDGGGVKELDIGKGQNFGE